jgi:outer membrane protein assembly factor BamB
MFDRRWERPLHQAGSIAALAASAGHLVVHERSTRLVSVDPFDGSVRWDAPVGTWPRSVVIADERCFVLPQTLSRHRWMPHHTLLICLDLRTGHRAWAAEIPLYVGHVVVSEDTVLVGGWRGYTPLTALDVQTGQLRWETDHPAHTVRPVPAGDGFLIGEPGSTTVRMVDRRDARQLSAWTLPHPLVDNDSGPVFTAAGAVHFLVRCGSHCVARIALTTDVVDEFVQAERSLRPDAPDEAGQLLWLSERGGGYTVADTETGLVRWRVDLAQPLVGRVVPAITGCVVAGRQPGTLFRLDHHGQVTERAVVTPRIRGALPLAPAQALILTKGTLLAIDATNSALQE